MINRKFNYGLISLSTPFIYKNRCKECGTGGVYYYCHAPNSNIYNRAFDRSSFSYSFLIKNLMNRYMYNPPYYRRQVITTSKINNFNIKSHMSVGVAIKNSSILIEGIYCKCFKTKWEFPGHSIKNRAEIRNRKSDRVFPHKFQ